MIIVDSREQLALWDDKIFNVKKKKLDEGDYTTESLYNKAHIERKNPADLASSITRGHVRFRKEILRAEEKGIKFAIFVECPEDTFYKKKFKGGRRIRTPGKVLKKILKTMEKKYELEIVWCENRCDMVDKMYDWFNEVENEIKNI